MWEVFNYVTGETIGYTPHWEVAANTTALRNGRHDATLDYIHECQNVDCDGQMCRPQP